VTAAVRPAEPADAGGIARVHVRSWHEAYTGVLSQTLLDRMDVARREKEWRRHLAHESPPGGQDLGLTWVAVDGAEVVGFATSGPGRDPDRTRADLELYAIYLLAAHHGTGAATALLAASLDDRPASLWVLEHNPRAQAFYAKHGFEPDGARREDQRFGEPIHEIRLLRP
jgi:GNAT superfamily N-acetyltransferase